jgi:hypothetical protein
MQREHDRPFFLIKEPRSSTFRGKGLGPGFAGVTQAPPPWLFPISLCSLSVERRWRQRVKGFIYVYSLVCAGS